MRSQVRAHFELEHRVSDVDRFTGDLLEEVDGLRGTAALEHAARELEVGEHREG